MSRGDFSGSMGIVQQFTVTPRLGCQDGLSFTADLKANYHNIIATAAERQAWQKPFAFKLVHATLDVKELYQCDVKISF